MGQKVGRLSVDDRQLTRMKGGDNHDVQQEFLFTASRTQDEISFRCKPG